MRVSHKWNRICNSPQVEFRFWIQPEIEKRPDQWGRMLLRPAVVPHGTALAAAFLIFSVLIVESTNDSQVRCSTTCVAENCDTIGIRYGKYCGVGWSGCPGEKPCDDVDACCQIHDDCVGGNGLTNIQCHEEFKRCIKKVHKSAKGRVF